MGLHLCIYEVAWIDEKWFEERDLDRVLQKNKGEKRIRVVNEIIDKLVTCRIPEDNDDLREKVVNLQTHGHKKRSCKKMGKVNKCRFGFPRWPSQETIIADSTLLDNLSDEEQSVLVKKYQNILIEARKILEDESIDEDMSYEDFINLLCSKMKYCGFDEMNQEYQNALRTSKNGCIIILKRSVKERFTNNYNPEWLSVWNGNIDIQIAMDIYAVITYVVSYVGKDESGMTNLLQQALKESDATSKEEITKILKNCYLTNRQCGAAEAIYLILPSLHLKDSNITCINLANGFPENRGVFYFKVKDTESADDNLESEIIGENIQDGQDIEIQGRTGRFRQSITLWDKYADRPVYLAKMCLAQFVSYYDYTKAKPTKSRIEDGYSQDEISEDKYIFGTDIKLPKYIKLKTISGYMRLRGHPTVIRFHSPNKKEQELEKFYALMFMFSAWNNEVKDLPTPRDPKAFYEKYVSVQEEIRNNRLAIFPLEDEFDLLDIDLNDLNNLPQHVGDQLDPQGEMDNEEDRAIGPEEDPEFIARDRACVHDDDAVPYEDCKYPVINVPSKNDLLEMTESLHPEQLRNLEDVAKFCKKVKRSEKTLEPVPGLRKIIHGGAGMLVIIIKMF